MSEIVTQPLVLNRKSKSSRFASWSGEGNFFYDKLLRVLYITSLFVINLVMFVYSINGKLIEDGVFNQAVMVLSGACFVLAFVIIFLFSFSKNMQNVICALFTMLFVAVFYYQFATFDVDNFVETWLMKKASWLTFICFIPSAWLVGLLLGIGVFFAFRNTFMMLFFTIVFVFATVSGVRKNEALKKVEEDFPIVKELGVNVGVNRNNNIVYFMIPKLPSYQFLGGVRDVNFRDLRNLLIGFFATNDFEIYPNAFVEEKGSMENIVDILNHVDYMSASSGNKGYSEFINNWNFIHGGGNVFGLDKNEMYSMLAKAGYGISTYSMPGFNFCMTGGVFNTDRCVIKGYKNISIYNKNSSLESNVYALLAEWLLNIDNKGLGGFARDFANMSWMKGYKVTSENRRVSIEGAHKVFDGLNADVKRDSNGQVYVVYVDLPSDIYIYDEFCNIKPRNQWVALKDNSIERGGIDEKRKAYTEQTKCLIGKLQDFIDETKKNNKLDKTDIIVQGVSSIRELGGMTGGKYGNFVTDKLVGLGIRKAKEPKFMINANICLASDFTKSLVSFQDFCYSIDNMKIDERDANNLKKNLINNSVIRGGRINSIAVNYRDWYENFKKNNVEYQERLKREQENLEKEKQAKLERQAREKKEKEALLQRKQEHDRNVSKDNIFIPTDDLIINVDEDIIEDNMNLPLGVQQLDSEEDEYIDLEGDIFDVTKEDVKIDVSNMEEVETELEAEEPVVEEDEVEETEAEAKVDEVDEIKVEEVKAEEPEVEEVKTEEPKDLENTDDSLIDLELDF